MLAFALLFEAELTGVGGGAMWDSFENDRERVNGGRRLWSRFCADERSELVLRKLIDRRDEVLDCSCDETECDEGRDRDVLVLEG